MDIRQAQPNRTCSHRLTWSIAAWFVLGGAVCCGQEAVAWKTGAALRKQLEASVSVTWGERPLREGLVNLTRSTGICIFLDRRIDPDQLVELSVRDQSVEHLLDQLAAKMEAQRGAVG